MNQLSRMFDQQVVEASKFFDKILKKNKKNKHMDVQTQKLHLYLELEQSSSHTKILIVHFFRLAQVVVLMP